ncbi:MAG: disulfide formation protein [Chlamydiia bacterium]|nr:disulfide formation protein [Chlamydiia bacterium]
MGFFRFIKRFSLYFAWTLATAGSLVTLYFSDVWLLPPCILCWYQRCCLYPLVFVLFGAVLMGANWIAYYLLPLPIVGGLIALTQLIEQSTHINVLGQLCRMGTSCAKTQVVFFGWISIPLMSLILFAILAILLLIAHEKCPIQRED